MSSPSHCFSLSGFSLPLTSDSSDLSLLFFFFFLISFSHTLHSHPLMAHGEASLFSRSALGGWPSDRRGWLQIEMGGFRLTWVASDQNGVVGGRGGVGSRGVVDGHGWPRVLLLVGISGWLEFQRCFNGVSGWME